MWKQLGKLLRDTRGATAVEYGLIVALIVLAVVGAMSLVATETIDKWNHVSNEVAKV